MNDGKPSNKHGRHMMSDGRPSNEHGRQGDKDGTLSVKLLSPLGIET
jgi:hypothetical protein